MKMITLGTTGITVPQNAFGALPVQRVNMDTAVQILRRAYDGGMRFFDTARAYSDSEEKMGEAFGHMRNKNWDMHLKACVTRSSLPARPWDAPRKISKNSWTHPYVC